MSTWPQYDDDQIAEVVGILKSGKVNAWTSPHVRAFEEDYEGYLGRRHAIAVANGTVALDLALIGLDLQPGDEVIVTPRSYVASAACVPLAGGVPVFADVDRHSQNLSAATIAEKITPRTRAIIVVHLAGWPCDMDEIMSLAEKHDLCVIEDCSQAHGATYNGRPVGSIGHIATFSFCQDKIITTGGEGGLVALDDDALWQRMWSYKDHGKNHDAVFRTDHPPGFRWLHESFGTNWRMTSIQAAMGSYQLARLHDTHAIRSRNAGVLIDAFDRCPALRIPVPPPSMEHAWYRLYAFVRPERLRPGWDRDRILAAMVQRGLPCFSGSCSEIYLEKAFRSHGFTPSERLEAARELGDTSFAFLIDPTIDSAALKRTAETFVEIVQAATVPEAMLQVAK